MTNTTPLSRERPRGSQNVQSSERHRGRKVRNARQALTEATARRTAASGSVAASLSSLPHDIHLSRLAEPCVEAIGPMAPHAAVPPPQSLRLDQPFAVEDAQRHLRNAAKRFPRARRARSTQQEPAPEVEPQLETATRVSVESQPPDLVNVQTTPEFGGDEKDVYAWAILFEVSTSFLTTAYFL
jgi:hypothetical protein